jgi:hypothetical protein
MKACPCDWFNASTKWLESCRQLSLRNVKTFHRLILLSLLLLFKDRTQMAFYPSRSGFLTLVQQIRVRLSPNLFTARCEFIFHRSLDQSAFQEVVTISMSLAVRDKTTSFATYGYG